MTEQDKDEEFFFYEESQEITDYKSYNYRDYIIENKVPKWMCPHCNEGYLKKKEKLLRYIESKKNEEIQRNPEFEPDWLEFFLSGFLECDACNEKTAVIGTGTYEHFEEHYNEVEGRQWQELAFMPEYFIPTVHIFKIPCATPDNVKEALIKSFSLAWCDFSSAANKLRISIEKLVDHLDENITAENLNGKIEQLVGKKNPNREKNQDIAIMLKAIKWIGNDGSHSKVRLNEYDVAFGYAVMEKILNHLYKKEIDILKISTLVDDNKGSLTKQI